MNVINHLGLREDPFGPANGMSGFGVAASTLATYDKLLAAVRRADPLTVLVGRPGMGKTLLLNMLDRACRADGLDVRLVSRGDMAHTALGSGAQLLLVDEADTINTATLTALAPGGENAAAPMMVFAVVQPALHRLSADVRTTVIDLRPLGPAEAEQFLLARAAAVGQPELFTPAALDIIVEAARGSPRLLRVLAGAAMFQAMSDAAQQIEPEHASLAASMHGSLLSRGPIEPVLPAAANDIEPRVDEAVGNPPPKVVINRARVSPSHRVGVLSFAASVALAALVLPVFLSPEPTQPSLGVAPASASQPIAGPVQLAASAFTVAPANAALPLRPAMPQGFAAVGPRIPVERPAVVSGPARIGPAAPTVGAGMMLPATVPVLAHRMVPSQMATVRPAVLSGMDRSAFIDLLGATRPRLAVASRTGARGEDGDGGEQAAARLDAVLVPTAPEAVPAIAAVAYQPPVQVATLATEPIVLVRTTAQTADETRAAGQAAAAARSTVASANEVATVKQTAATAEVVKTAATSARHTAQEAQSAKTAAQQAKETGRLAGSGKEASEQAKLAKAAAEQGKSVRETAKQAAAAKDSTQLAQSAKLAADQAKAAKEAAAQVKSGKEAAAQAKAAKEAAEQAKAAKDAAEQAKAAKEASEQAKSAKEAAEQAKAAKDAADQAKAAKEAADQAKAAKEAADQAKAAKEAAEQAKAGKEAAEQAKAAKDAAEQAKAAKEAAEQAKAAKEAAEQAKAVKEAAEQAKAAKDAAEQAQAAKEAADQARAAKDAADQAKAAKDAADQAKAAKEAAEQAKAAKEAAEQAQAAKEAAEQAKIVKDAAQAAKDAKDAAKAAKDAAKAAKDAAKRN